MDDRPHAEDRLRSPGWVLLPLRAFLGVTFVFAGAQKLADPNFFRSTSPSSIQTQLAAAVPRSPIGPHLAGLTHHAIAAGILIAFAELAIGAGTILGLWSRIAAVGGALLSLGFLLTVSWHTHPYYFGPDIVFLFAWMPLVLVGDGGVLSLEATRVRQLHPGVDLDRRAFLATARTAAVVAGGVAVFGSLAAAVGRLAGGTSGSPTPTAQPTLRPPALGPSSTTTTTTGPGSSTTPNTSPAPPGTDIGPVSAVPTGGAATFQDPTTGEPAVVLRSGTGVRAFSAVCTHAGCTVRFTGSDFACPCHGARFSSTDGTATQGPAQEPLSSIPVTVGPDGHLYVGPG